MSATPKFQMLRPRDDAAARELPASADVETHILSCCLQDGRPAIERALLEGVNENCFHAATRKVVWQTLVELYRKNAQVTFEMLVVELQSRHLLEAAGGMEAMLAISQFVPTTAHLGYMVQRARELSARRWLIAEGGKIVEQAYAFAGDGDKKQHELEEVMRAHVSTFVRGLSHIVKRSQMPKSLAEELEGVAADFADRAAGRVDKSGWIYTGWEQFDRSLLPLGSQREDNYVILGGWSGFGKSAKSGQIVGNAVERGQRARVYSMEVSTAGFIELMVARKIGVDLRHPERVPADKQRAFLEECRRLAADVADKRLWCVQQGPTTPLRTIEDLEEDARMFVRLQGAPHVWMVDYAQLLSTRKRVNNREQENAIISGTFQALSRELGGVWIVCAQLNEQNRRESLTPHRDKDGMLIHRFPDRGDLRESQRYYHDADRVLFIYRPPEDCRGADQSSTNGDTVEQWIVQDKRRRGGGGKFVKGWFEKCYTRFRMFGAEDLAYAAQQQKGKVTNKADWKAQHGRS